MMGTFDDNQVRNCDATVSSARSSDPPTSWAANINRTVTLFDRQGTPKGRQAHDWMAATILVIADRVSITGMASTRKNL